MSHLMPTFHFFGKKQHGRRGAAREHLKRTDVFPGYSASPTFAQMITTPGLPFDATTALHPTLATLALCNPTYIQLKLLRSLDAVKHFVRASPQFMDATPLPAGLDDDTLVALAKLDPNPSPPESVALRRCGLRKQLRLLPTAESVRRFVLAHSPPTSTTTTHEQHHELVATAGPVSIMYNMAKPLQPSFQWLSSTNHGPFHHVSKKYWNA